MFRGKHKAIYLLCFIVFILILSAYSNSLYAPFTLDDKQSFVEEAKVLNFSFSYEGVSDLTETKFGLYRFLPMLTFALDLQWGSGSILAFHITNIIIHLLATLALFFLLTSLFAFLSGDTYFLPDKWRTSTTLIAIFTVGVWALSSVQTNAVTYLVQRMTSIAALFYFAALGCYLRGRAEHLGDCLNRKVIVWYILFLVAGICSLLSKQNSATLPIIVVLIEFLFVCNGSIGQFFKKYKIVVVLTVIFVLPLVFHKLSSGLLDGYDTRHFTLSERMLTELRIVSSYIFLLLLPLPRFLNFEHDPVVSTSLFSPISTLSSLIFLIVIILGAWRVRKQYPLLTFCIYWFFINLLIESSVIPLELEFEHRLYLPSAGFYLACVLLFCKAGAVFIPDIDDVSNHKTLLVTSMILLLSCLSLLTYQRNMVWQDSVTLYQDCLRKSPQKARVHSCLAKALSDQGKYDEAIKRAEKALSLGVRGNEDYWVTANNIIFSLSKMGDNPAAMKRGESLLLEAPSYAKKNSFPIFLGNMARIYLKEKEYQRAFDLNMQGLKFASLNKGARIVAPFLESFESYVLITLKVCEEANFTLDLGEWDDDSEGLSVFEKMAKVCFSINEMAMAVKYCEKAVDENPSSSACLEIENKIDKFNTLNSTQAQKGTIKTKYYQHPFTSKFNFCMASAYGLMRLGLPDNFMINYFLELANDTKPDNVDVRLLRSWLFYKAKSFSDAIREIDEAIILDNKYAQLWINRGLYCIEAGKNKEALKAFAKGLDLYPGYPKKNRLKVIIDTAIMRLLKTQGGVHE